MILVITDNDRLPRWQAGFGMDRRQRIINGVVHVATIEQGYQMWEAHILEIAIVDSGITLDETESLCLHAMSKSIRFIGSSEDC